MKKIVQDGELNSGPLAWQSAALSVAPPWINDNWCKIRLVIQSWGKIWKKWNVLHTHEWVRACVRACMRVHVWGVIQWNKASFTTRLPPSTRLILESFVNFLSFVGHPSLGKCLPIPPSLRSVVIGWNIHLGRGGNKGRKYTQLEESVLCHDVIPVVKDPIISPNCQTAFLLNQKFQVYNLICGDWIHSHTQFLTHAHTHSLSDKC